MKRRYRIITQAVYPHYRLDIRRNTADVYPGEWSIVGLYDSPELAKQAAADYSDELDRIERIKGTPPEEFEA